MGRPITIPPLHTERPTDAELARWESTLWETGYLIIPDALPREACEHFRARVAEMYDHPVHGSRSLVNLFEHGMDFVQMLENQPVFALMERLFGPRMHVISLQGHRMVRGNEVSRFHSDELYAPQPAGGRDDTEYPPIINVVNCHYYVVDVPPELGPTEVVPGTHRAWRQPVSSDGEPPRWRGQGPVTLSCKAGDCVMYSNQVWHHGAPNQTDRTRLSVVPSYAHRFIAQRFWPYLNYNLSRDILDRCTPRQRELLGEHPRAAYG
jgi:hypothetical protein